MLWVGTMVANAHEPSFSEQADIKQVIKAYADRTGTKFVLDPRVMAKVNMIGVDINELSQTNLMDILLVYGFTAFERDGVVHVLPQAAVD